MNKVLCLVLLMTACISSCKYDEGPDISFISAKYRVTGNYRLEKFYINDTDTTNYYNGLICNSGFSFNIADKDIYGIEGYIKPYMPTYIIICPFNFTGRWELVDNKNTLRTSIMQNIPVLGPWGSEWSFDWNIIKLTDDEMHLGGKSYNTTYRLEFKKI